MPSSSNPKTGVSAGACAVHRAALPVNNAAIVTQAPASRLHKLASATPARQSGQASASTSAPPRRSGVVHRPLHLPSHRVRCKTMSTIAPSPARPKATLFWVSAQLQLANIRNTPVALCATHCALAVAIILTMLTSTPSSSVTTPIQPRRAAQYLSLRHPSSGPMFVRRDCSRICPCKPAHLEEHSKSSRRHSTGGQLATQPALLSLQRSSSSHRLLVPEASNPSLQVETPLRELQSIHHPPRER